MMSEIRWHTHLLCETQKSRPNCICLLKADTPLGFGTLASPSTGGLSWSRPGLRQSRCFLRRHGLINHAQKSEQAWNVASFSLTGTEWGCHFRAASLNVFLGNVSV